MADQMRINDGVVESLRRSIFQGNASLDCVPGLIRRILKEDMWQDRTIVKTGKAIHFDRFEEFVARSPLEGLGANMQVVRNLIRDDPEAMDLLDKAIQSRAGRPETVDNINNIEGRPAGTSAAAAIRRLRKDRPDLHKEVIAGKKSPHAAMVEAGFRQRPTPLIRLKTAWGSANERDRQNFLSWIEQTTEVRRA